MKQTTITWLVLQEKRSGKWTDRYAYIEGTPKADELIAMRKCHPFSLCTYRLVRRTLIELLIDSQLVRKNKNVLREFNKQYNAKQKGMFEK